MLHLSYESCCACTAIVCTAADGSTMMARTLDWELPILQVSSGQQHCICVPQCPPPYLCHCYDYVQSPYICATAMTMSSLLQPNKRLCFVDFVDFTLKKPCLFCRFHLTVFQIRFSIDRSEVHRRSMCSCVYFEMEDCSTTLPHGQVYHLFSYALIVHPLHRALQCECTLCECTHC